jgi:flagellar basal body rod protein FlgG
MSKFTVNGKSAEGLDIMEKAISHMDLPDKLQSQIFEAVLGMDGTPLHYNGKRVFKRSDGTLVDENGNIVLGKNGKPLTMDANDEIINTDGNKADMSKFTVSGESVEGIDLIASAIDISELPDFFKPSSIKSLTGPDGSPLMFDGKKVFKRADGTLVDENGNIVLGKNDKPLTMSANGEIINTDGSKADMSKFTVNGESAEGIEISTGVDTSSFSVNGNTATGPDLMKIESSKLPSIGDTGIRVTSDGLLIDIDGKEISHNGRAIRRGKDGKLFYNDGTPVLDDQGREVFMDDDGKLHDGEGKEVTGVTLLNGNNQLVGGSELEAKKIGDSDIFLNKRNNLVDVSNKPFIHKGKPILVKDGKLVTDDNKPVVDIKGNPISITRSGSLIDRSRLPAKGAFVTDVDGVVIDNKGRYVNSGGKMTALSDGGPYMTEGGLLVDKDGKAILINGKQVYVDEQNQLISHNGRAVRYNGRKLHLNKRGNVLDENDQVLSYEGEIVTLTNDGLTGSSGKSFNNTPKTENSPRSLKNVKEFFKKEDVQSNLPTKDAPKRTLQEQINKDNEDNKQETVDEETTLTAAQILHVNARYEKRKAFLLGKVKSYKSQFTAETLASVAAVGGGEYVDEISKSKKDADIASNDGNPLSDQSTYEEGDEKYKAGRMLYAVNTYKVNTDLNTKLVFNLFGVERGSKLYKGTAHGQVELVYDYIVVNFTKICPVEGKCIPFEGVGVDPGTSEAAIDGDIDRHFWYRFGGLSLAALFQGAAEAVESSKERTEQTDEFGKTVTYSGLDQDKLLISSTNVLAETLGGIFTENVSRPYSGIIKKDEEIGIFLMEDLIIKK